MYIPLLGLLLYEFVDLQSLTGQLVNLQLINGPPLLQLVLLQHHLCLLQILRCLHVLRERGNGLRQKLRDAHTVAEKGLYLLRCGGRGRKLDNHGGIECALLWGK